MKDAPPDYRCVLSQPGLLCSEIRELDAWHLKFMPCAVWDRSNPSLKGTKRCAECFGQSDYMKLIKGVKAGNNEERLANYFEAGA
eukprot:5744017-Amphidinium_carterae.1